MEGVIAILVALIGGPLVVYLQNRKVKRSTNETRQLAEEIALIVRGNGKGDISKMTSATLRQLDKLENQITEVRGQQIADEEQNAKFRKETRSRLALVEAAFLDARIRERRAS